MIDKLITWGEKFSGDTGLKSSPVSPPNFHPHVTNFCRSFPKIADEKNLFIFFYVRHRSSTIDFSAASDRFWACWNRLIKENPKSGVSFVISALLKNFLS